jgi:ribosomal protein S13
MEPLDIVDTAAEATSHKKLNAAVAITVALLATFMGICKVKDDNICQSMQAAQANKIDHWNFYQARNIREEVAKGTLVQLRLAAVGRPAAEQEGYQQAIKQYETLVADQDKKKAEAKASAEQDQKDYDAANFKDDQFDLSDTLLAIAISMLAVTALTQQFRLYLAAMVPTGFGVLMGLAGLLGWQIHPGGLIALLS